MTEAEKPKAAATITLEEPIVRGEQVIETIELRRPQAGELRGLSLSDLLNMEVTAVIKLAPRICRPVLLGQEIAALPPQDLVSIAAEIAGFLLPKSAREAGFPTE